MVHQLGEARLIEQTDRHGTDIQVYQLGGQTSSLWAFWTEVYSMPTTDSRNGCILDRTWVRVCIGGITALPESLYARQCAGLEQVNRSDLAGAGRQAGRSS
jgi:hypothetical protein